MAPAAGGAMVGASPAAQPEQPLSKETDMIRTAPLNPAQLLSFAIAAAVLALAAALVVLAVVDAVVVAEQFGVDSRNQLLVAGRRLPP